MAMKRKNITAGIFIGLLLLSFVVSGCGGNSGKPKHQVEQYMLNYQSPVWENMARLDATIRFDRFTVFAGFNNTAMMFRPDDFRIDSFNYNRWAVNPADMIADNLLRDMWSSGLFIAVFPRHAVEEGRYILQAAVEEFFLGRGNEEKSAVLNLTVTLKDSQERDSTKRILFQKKYRHSRKLADPSPRGYCEAMSLALQAVSRSIIADAYEAIKAAAK